MTKPAASPEKLLYIDNIKVIMTALVVMHHTAVTYGAPGGWYYAEKTTHVGALIPLTMFVAVNQSFFMGFFFLLSAYFTPASYDKKGPCKFLSDRLLRLGIPLLFYSLVFSPFLDYLVYYFAGGHHITYAQFLGGFDNWIDFGVLWFVAALLLFTFIYAGWRAISKQPSREKLKAPNSGRLLVFAFIVGIISFLVRVVFPVGKVLRPLGFQLGHFSQYIAFFIGGLLAFRNNWFEQLSARTGKTLGLVATGLFLIFPIFYVIKMKSDMPIAWFSGGLHWQSLLYAVWEQSIGISILTALLVIGRQFWNRSSPLLRRLSRAAFAVYIFHPLVIISLSLLMRNRNVDPAVKFLIVAPLAVTGSFLLGMLIVLVPGVKKVV